MAGALKRTALNNKRMTQLEKSLEELNKDRSQFNGMARLARQDSKYFLYVKDEGLVFAVHITGLD